MRPMNVEQSNASINQCKTFVILKEPQRKSNLWLQKQNVFFRFKWAEMVGLASRDRFSDRDESPLILVSQSVLGRCRKNSEDVEHDRTHIMAALNSIHAKCIHKLHLLLETKTTQYSFGKECSYI
jgi:hypothetical protein